MSRARFVRIATAALALAAVASCGTPAPAQPAGPPPAKVLQLNATGEAVDLAAALVPGQVTIVDFWAEWCGGCKIVDAKVMAAIGDLDGVVVRKIDIGDGETPVARQYQVGALPHVRIFDRAGNLRYVLAGSDALTAGDVARALAAEP